MGWDAMNFIRQFTSLTAAALLGGCVAQAETVEDPLLWGRVDCQRLAENPALQQDFDQAKTICLSRAQAASVAGTANMPGGYGIGSAMVAGMNKGIASNQIATATVNGCMGEMGYLFKTRSEHLAICEAITEQRQRVAAATAPVAVKKRTAGPAKLPVQPPPSTAPVEMQ
jgi:hypothetical protein